jgi:hypothetical protein
MHPTHFVQQQGRVINVGAEFVDVNGMFLCRDNRYVMIEGGPAYTKLLKGYLNFFDCGYNQKSIAREVAKWDSAELEVAFAKAAEHEFARVSFQWQYCGVDMIIMICMTLLGHY